MPRHPEHLFAPTQRWPWIAIAASVAVHSLLLFCWIEGRQPILPRRPSQLIVLAPPAEGPAAVPMPFDWLPSLRPTSQPMRSLRKKKRHL